MPPGRSDSPRKMSPRRDSGTPGPLSTTQAQLTDALVAGGLAEVPAGYADRYRRWRERFNARDDGHAAERVVARILDQGYIDRA